MIQIFKDLINEIKVNNQRLDQLQNLPSTMNRKLDQLNKGQIIEGKKHMEAMAYPDSDENEMGDDPMDVQTEDPQGFMSAARKSYQS